ncbi:stage III sporulation protein AF [Acidilutibacter cellobiosedens]|uniref:stage III sporulation protein AF n=1 Tax=Acidilutibacter cellobiosedens TaxID=2507161 RepID=UPI00137642BD|nr:stage III sporulation protein AF [Acidilutibacter cellobiosedens]
MEYISFLKDWAVNIVILFILISFLEIILPSGNMKRFLDMVIGILVIIAIMNPIIKLLNKNKDIDVDKSLLTSSVETMNISYKENDDLLAAQKEQVITAYKNKLKREIEEIISSNTNYSVSDIKIELQEDEEREDYGNIKKIEMDIKEAKEEKKEEEGEKKNIKIDDIEEITVSKNQKPSSTNREIIDNKDIKDVISENFNVPYENIVLYKNTKLAGDENEITK